MLSVDMTQDFINAGIQIFVVLILSLVCWLITALFCRKQQKIAPSFFYFTGLHVTGFSWNRDFARVFTIVISLGIFSTIFQYYFVDEFISFSKSDSSPYWKILKEGFSFPSIVRASIYCWLQAGLSEEMLFRGLIAKRLIGLLGYKWGNISQAFIFWLLHFALIGFVTDNWLSLLQLIVLITIFPIALLMGYANEKISGGSIIASWTLHGGMNFIAFFLLAYLLL